jgi:RAD50-interacting protein 1
MASTLTVLHINKQYLTSLPDQQHAAQFAKDIIDSDSLPLEQLIQQKDKVERQVSAASNTREVVNILQLETSRLDSKLEEAHNSLRDYQASLSLLSDSQKSLSTSIKQLVTAAQPPSLLQDLEVLQAKLIELQRVRDYVSVIHHALQLSELSVQSIRDSLPADGPPKTLNASILEPFSQLQTFISSVRDAVNPIRSDCNFSLSPFLSELQRRTWVQLRELLSE